MKLVVELASGQRVEMALILHDHKSSGGKRCTVRLLRVGCSRERCSARRARRALVRANLGAAQILEQVWHARNEVPVGYEVNATSSFMGMGEPLDNLPVASLRGLTHQALFDLSGLPLTVSTVGASPERIRRLADLAPGVRLALSLWM